MFCACIDVYQWLSLLYSTYSIMKVAMFSSQKIPALFRQQCWMNEASSHYLLPSRYLLCWYHISSGSTVKHFTKKNFSLLWCIWFWIIWLRIISLSSSSQILLAATDRVSHMGTDKQSCRGYFILPSCLGTQGSPVRQSSCHHFGGVWGSHFTWDLTDCQRVFNSNVSEVVTWIGLSQTKLLEGCPATPVLGMFCCSSSSSEPPSFVTCPVALRGAAGWQVCCVVVSQTRCLNSN